MQTEINKDILEISKKYSCTIDKEASAYAKSKNIQFHKDVVPMFYPQFEDVEKTILFLGLNPSLTQEIKNSLENEKILSFSDFLNNRNSQAAILERLINFQEELKGKKVGGKIIPYFKSINNFFTDLEMAHLGWDHYDLFPFRCTSHKIPLKLLKDYDLAEYHSASINRLKMILKNLKFKVIISLNRNVSEILKKELGLVAKENTSEQFRNPLYGKYDYDGITIYLFKQLSGGGTTQLEREIFVKLLKIFIKN